jgi:hypothetical protein
MSRILEVTTESGSVYLIDDEHKTWFRMRGKGARVMRDGGEGFITHSPIVVGSPLILICPPINPPYDRIVASTPVISVRETVAN